MTTKQLNYKALPIIAAADGATSPALTANDKGAMAFSTTTNKPMSWDGTKWNLLTKVDSVAGRTGAVTVTKTDVGLNSVDNVAAASLRDRTTHTGEQAITSVTGLQTALDTKASTGHTHSNATTTVAGFMSNTDKTKLDGIATGATAYVHPANHPASVITQDANNRFVSDTEKATWDAKQPAGNYATLDETGKITATQLPSFVSDVLEFADIANFPATGESAKIYVALDSNKTYRWSDSAYVATLSGAVDSVAGKTGVVTLTKADVGLGNVDNTSDVNKPVSSAQLTAINNRAPISHVGATGIAHGEATTSVAGFMPSIDKIKLNKIIINEQVGLNIPDGYSVAVGSFAMGSGNIDRSIAIGGYALNKGGRDNVAIGYRACSENVGGFQNVAIGTLSLRSNVSNSFNTAVGYGSAEYTVGANNVCVGVFAGSNCGFDNVAIGNRALQYSYGSNNIGIGNTSSGSTSGNNNIVIGQGTPVFAITGATSNHIVMGSSTATNAYIKVAWTVVSDARDKTNFAAIPHGLEFVKQLKPTAYQFKVSRNSDTTNGGVRYGFKAQDIAAIEPEAVIVDTTNPEKLYYNESNLIPVLVKAIQELSAEVERLKNAN